MCLSLCRGGILIVVLFFNFSIAFFSMLHEVQSNRFVTTCEVLGEKKDEFVIDRKPINHDLDLCSVVFVIHGYCFFSCLKTPSSPQTLIQAKGVLRKIELATWNGSQNYDDRVSWVCATAATVGIVRLQGAEYMC